MKWANLPLCLMLLFFSACAGDSSSTSLLSSTTVPLKPLDLNTYGIPMVILAPDSATILEKDYKFMRDITIQKGRDFSLQLFEITSAAGDAAGEKLHQLASIKKDPFFKAIVREEDYGFIFSKRLDSLTLDYDFRFVRLFGDKEVIFQTGLTHSFTLEQVKRMYNAVRR